MTITGMCADTRSKPGYPAPARAVEATVQRLLNAQPLRPVQYCLERRNPRFLPKMQEVLQVRSRSRWMKKPAYRPLVTPLRTYALDIAAPPRVVIFSAGTDGTDGPTDAAGAIADGRTLARNPEARRSLDRNDSYHCFQPLGDLVITGPTNTNVMDVHLILVGSDK